MADRAEEMARAQEFVARASHELRTPLSSIVGYAELLLDDAGGLSDQQIAQIEAIKRNASRLERTIAALLAAAEEGVGAGAANWLENQPQPERDE